MSDLGKNDRIYDYQRRQGGTGEDTRWATMLPNAQISKALDSLPTHCMVIWNADKKYGSSTWRKILHTHTFVCECGESHAE